MKQVITVEVMQHEATGLLVAVSEDVKGLYVHGRSPEELEARIPQALRAIFEADGRSAGRIEKRDGAPKAPPFRKYSARYDVETMAA